MTNLVRMFAVGGTAALVTIGGIAAFGLMQATAEEPAQVVERTIADLFPSPPLDASQFRKYAISFDETVSTEVQSSSTVTKIGFGHKSVVSIVTTPSGTYSSDALLSPHVRYPGIEVKPKLWREGDLSISTFTSESGTGRWTSFSRGSFTYYTYSFTPTTRS